MLAAYHKMKFGRKTLDDTTNIDPTKTPTSNSTPPSIAGVFQLNQACIFAKRYFYGQRTDKKKTTTRAIVYSLQHSL